jgi:hypothetical protein
MEAILHKSSAVEVMFRTQVIVDYDLPLHPRVLPRNIKDLSDDILKVTVHSKRTGKWIVDIGLIFVGKRLDHVKAKEIIKEELLTLAGIHETLTLLPLIHELPVEKFRFTALKEEMIERGVEFVLTVYGTKKNAYAVMDFRDFLPDKSRLFAVEFGKAKKV